MYQPKLTSHRSVLIKRHSLWRGIAWGGGGGHGKGVLYSYIPVAVVELMIVINKNKLGDREYNRTVNILKRLYTGYFCIHLWILSWGPISSEAADWGRIQDSGTGCRDGNNWWMILLSCTYSEYSYIVRL